MSSKKRLPNELPGSDIRCQQQVERNGKATLCNALVGVAEGEPCPNLTVYIKCRRCKRMVKFTG